MVQIVIDVITALEIAMFPDRILIASINPE